MDKPERQALIAECRTSGMTAKAWCAYINESKGLYYKAFTLISNNFKVSEMLDVTPFVSYFIDNVLTKLQKKAEPPSALKTFNNLLQTGEIPQ